MIITLERSKLDDVYSLSSKLTCKEMWDSMPGSSDALRKMTLELNKYIDPYTGKVQSDHIIFRKSCPLCDSENFEFLFLKHGFDHMLCNSCDLIFTLQILDNTKLGHLEEGDEGDQYGEYKENTQVNEMDRKKFEIVFEELEKILIGWSTHVKIKQPIVEKASRLSYKIMNKKAKEDYCNKILHLFQSIDIQSIEIKEELNSDRTYGKLSLKKNIIINKPKSLL